MKIRLTTVALALSLISGCASINATQSGILSSAEAEALTTRVYPLESTENQPSQYSAPAAQLMNQKADQLNSSRASVATLNDSANTQPPGQMDTLNYGQLLFSSVFDGYMPFDETPQLDWVEANDKVGQVGGWRAYARMVQEQQKREQQMREQSGTNQ